MRFAIGFIVLFFSKNLLAWNSHFCHYHSDVKSGEKPVLSPSQSFLQAQYDVKFHHLDLTVERTSTFVKGSVRTVAKVIGNQLDTFAFELHPRHTIDSIIFQGQSIPFKSSGAERKAILPSSISQNQLIDITIFYRGTPPTAISAAIGAGFSNDNSGRWGNQVTWSLSQPFAAYEWWPCKQDLVDKIDSTWFFITTNSSNKAASNGLLTNVVNLGNGSSRYEWKSKHPIDYYLVSVAVAQYVDYSFKTKIDGVADSVLIQNYIYNNPQTLPTFKADIDRTAAMLQLFSNLFGVYPFADEKYGHAMAPFSGGMEHQTMTTLGFFDFELIAHELGHQWFGDYVTCSTWKDIFVNEGFASYSEYLAQEFLNSSASAKTKMQSVHDAVMTSPGGAIWFTDSTNVNRIFDSRLSYEKGSAIIHSMRYTVNNDSVFFLALKTFQIQKGNDVASAQDFKQVLETVSGLNFDTFFDQWFYGEGYPIFNVKWNADTNKLVVKLTQTTSSLTTPLFKTYLDLNVPRAGLSDTLIRVFMDQNVQTFQIPIVGLAKSIGVDPANWIMNITNGISRDTTLFIETLTGIKGSEIELKASLSPNPASHSATIQIEGNQSNEYTLQLFDLSGKLHEVGIQKTSNTSYLIDLSTLSNSVYIVKLFDKNRLVNNLRLVVIH